MTPYGTIGFAELRKPDNALTADDNPSDTQRLSRLGDNLIVGSGQCFVPMWDGKLVQFPYAETAEVFDLTNGIAARNAIPVVLAYLSQLWLHTFTPTVGKVILENLPLEGHHLYSGGTPIGSVAIYLDTTNFQGDKTYGGMEYGNYGVISFITINGENEPVQWLNFNENVMYPMRNIRNSFEVYLKPGVKGYCRIFGQDSVPYLQYNFAGQSFRASPYENRTF